MVTPRALVFRPLVKGNEASGNEIGKVPAEFFKIVQSPTSRSRRQVVGVTEGKGQLTEYISSREE